MHAQPHKQRECHLLTNLPYQLGANGKRVRNKKDNQRFVSSATNNIYLLEIVREQKRALNRSIRSLERESRKLEAEEAKLIMQIKKSAEKGQMKSINIMAKDLVRMRKHREKFASLKAQLRAISLNLTVKLNMNTRD